MNKYLRYCIGIGSLLIGLFLFHYFSQYYLTYKEQINNTGTMWFVSIYKEDSIPQLFLCFTLIIASILFIIKKNISYYFFSLFFIGVVLDSIYVTFISERIFEGILLRFYMPVSISILCIILLNHRIAIELFEFNIKRKIKYLVLLLLIATLNTLNTRIFNSITLMKTSVNNIQDSVKLADISSRSEEGFSDIYLKIISDTKTDSTHIYIAKGLYNGKTVGLQFEVKSMIGAGIANGQLSGGGLAADGVRLKSIGQESDEFIKAMSNLYKFPTTNGFSKDVISTTAISLNDKPADLCKMDIYKFKLFFAEADLNLYSELFFNINLKEGEIKLLEKDQGYREPLIKVWTK